MELNELVSEILQRCDCLEYSQSFAAIPKSEFREFSLEDVRSRLPDTDEARNAAEKIYHELIRFSNIQNNSINTADEEGLAGEAPNESTVKAESDDSSDCSSDNEPSLFQPRPKTVVEVSLEDSEDENEGSRNDEETLEEIQQETPQSSRYSLRRRRAVNLNYDDDFSDDDTEAPRGKRHRGPDDAEESEIVCVRNPVPLLKKLHRQPDYIDQCSHIALCPENDFDALHSCKYDDALEVDSKHWMEFYKKFGASVYSLQLRIWSWKSVKSKCPFNLLKILSSFFPNLVELHFKVGAVEGALENATFPRGQLLPNLKKLAVAHPGPMTFKSQLKSIIGAASNLESFEYQFSEHSDANEVLEMLEGLTGLKSASVRSYARDGYLKKEQIERLKELSLPNLEELELGNGLWEDVEGSLIESLLKTTPNLKKLRIFGNYQGNSLHKPDVTISIPPLHHLEVLEIGGNYEFASVDESQRSRAGPSNGIVTVDDELQTDLFSITLKFPLLQNLKTMILGNLYKIDELHFSSFPKLESLRVGSPWHLAVKFPEKESRKFSYPLVTELQLPDCLKDPSFVQKIPERFPNLKKCWIFLPSVKVLRTFFRSMENSGLEELYLKTQFDFEATMELCLLGRPSQAPRSYRDFMKHEELEEYGKFEEFVRFYNIELPPKKAEDVQELEDPTCAGLAALKNLKILHLEHIPRVLRIPKGNLHWTHTNAEFTGSYIGFKRYPLSRKCIEALPLQKLQTCMWPNFDVYVRDTAGLQNAGFVDLDGDSDLEIDTSAPGSSKTRRSKRGEKLKVQIHPAMLQANIKFTQKEEKP